MPRRCSSCWGRAARLAGVCLVQSTPLWGQGVSVHPLAAVEVITQGGPLGGQFGIGGAVGLAAPITRWLSLTSNLDLAIFTKSGDDISLCLPVPAGGCLVRHSGDAIFGANVSVDLEVPTAHVRPFIAAGPALVLGGANPGERSSWTTPQLEGGLRVRSAHGQWGLSLRWRRVDRWRTSPASAEYGLMLGFRSGVPR